MRKIVLVFILLLLPVVAFSQVTYEEIMSINSIDTFKRVVIENGYSRQIEMEEDYPDGINLIFYTLNYRSSDEEKMISLSFYDIDNGQFVFVFGQAELKIFDTYEIIVSDIKEKCDYYKIINFNNVDYVAYSCPDSKYKGKIGFTRDDGDGYIMHMIEDID